MTRTQRAEITTALIKVSQAALEGQSELSIRMAAAAAHAAGASDEEIKAAQEITVIESHPAYMLKAAWAIYMEAPEGAATEDALDLLATIQDAAGAPNTSQLPWNARPKLFRLTARQAELLATAK